ncbi:MAG: hypothetical protein H6Q90_1437 [Deltaproteobacteria bacterium]|nr:hypothetical protein [Deltaproteobacteria bacterium]
MLFAVAIGGCYASSGVGFRAAYVGPPPVATVTVGTTYDQPDLVEVSPGVQVIADYDEPVFYSDNFYWRFSGNTWYRSSVHTGGWVVYNDVPYSVRRIDRPTTYVRYRPSGYVPRGQRQPVVRDHRDPYQPAVRDHRQPQPAPYQPAPVVRDHRQPQPAPYQPPAPPVVRDHRAPQPAPYQPPAAPPPVVRDHREPAAPYRPAPPAAPVQRDHRDPKKKDERDHR